MHQVQLFENEWKLWVSSLEQLEKSWLVYIFPPQVLRAQVLLMVQDVWDTYPIIYEHKWKGPAGGGGGDDSQTMIRMHHFGSGSYLCMKLWSREPPCVCSDFIYIRIHTELHILIWIEVGACFNFSVRFSAHLR